MFEPLRFLHVAEARLDRPLQEAGSFSASMRSRAMDATLSAFEQMVDGAIAHQVDFVLLAGNTFCEADESLRARLCLLRGLEKLHEEQIAVFALPGRDDPETAWQAISDLPANVTVLDPGDSADEESATPVAVLREGRVIATITSGSLSQLASDHADSRAPDSHREESPPANGQVRPTPFRVGMLADWPEDVDFSDEDLLFDRLSACRRDYLAVPASEGFPAGRTLNTQEGIAHHPGPLQALSPAETGPHGATMIEVDQKGEIRGTFLPLASLRRLEWTISMEEAGTLEDIREAMQSRLVDEPAYDGETAWLITWILRVGEESLADLQDPEMQEELIESLPGHLSESPEIVLEHRLRLEEASPGHPKKDGLSDLERLYCDALEKAPGDEADLTSLLTETIETLENSDWQDRLLPLAAGIDFERVHTQARQLGRTWFHESRNEG